MKRQGISEIIATVLLIGMTLAGTATVYQLTQDRTETGEEYQPDIKLTELSLERCYTKNSKTYIVLRNSNTEAINASLLNVYIDGKPLPNSDYSADPEIVDPKESFEIDLATTIGSRTQIKLAGPDDSITRRCLSG